MSFFTIFYITYYSNNSDFWLILSEIYDQMNKFLHFTHAQCTQFYIHTLRNVCSNSTTAPIEHWSGTSCPPLNSWQTNGPTKQTDRPTNRRTWVFSGKLQLPIISNSLLDLWKEIGPKWPRSYWDDWMRDPAQRQERACIRPEISRTKTFGKIGVSNGLFFDKHLKYIVLNTKFVPFTVMDLSYLEKGNYDTRYIEKKTKWVNSLNTFFIYIECLLT